ncbi:HEPN domain-containing protein [Methylophilus sp.]|uniref:HEPN domain-containing protein n=1 Tax=Methylophilus sp. TaxID=29541 RepID=UPI000D4AEE87|nr:HEPN domain-containing protein [Methylophilus sp.]PPD11648.1 MAG: hypothetical protein CTY26_08170 [Methylophilus sp.]
MTLSTEEKALLYSAAAEYFRNPADEDYILARVKYRLGLMNQFQWSALQAVEKYLKAILLFNLKKTTGLNHNIVDALSRIESEIQDFSNLLSDSERKFIQHLNKFGVNRYVERESYAIGNELILLDSTVWALRKYCQVLNQEITHSTGNKTNLLEINLKTVNRTLYKNKPYKFRISGGLIEKVLNRNNDDPLRKSLIWKNQMFGKRKASFKRLTFQSFSGIPLHIRYPEQSDLLRKFIQLPKLS